MKRFFFVSAFGLLGVLLRYAIAVFYTRFGSLQGIPIHTFAINLLGSFLIGVAYVAGTERGMLSPDLRVGIMTGFLGGFTTFSSYSLESLRLFENDKFALGLGYLGLSPILGLACAWLGIVMTRLCLG